MKKLISMLTFILSILTFSPANAVLEWEGIQFVWEWTKDRHYVSEEVEMPVITFLSMKDVQEEYIKRTIAWLTELVDEKGVEKGAVEYFEWVSKVRAFYDEEQEHMFISNLGDECLEASILAHEFTHHFQKVNNLVCKDPYAGCEETAYSTEKYYYKIFCEESADAMQ